MSTNDTTNQIKDVLKKYQLRITEPRQLILGYLATHHNHPSVEMIREGLAKKTNTLGVATIYNILNTFVDHGIVIELKNGDGSTHYDYFENHHYHAICTNCGRITDIDYPGFHDVEHELEDQAAAQSGYLISGNHFEVYGICPQCQAKLRIKRA